MNGVLIPIKWHTFSASAGPVAIAWAGWFNGQYVEVHAYSVTC